MIISKQQKQLNYISDSKKYKITNFIISFFIILTIILIVINPKRYIESCHNGLLTWANNILPSLFPFLIFTKILIELNALNFIANKFSNICNFLFRAPAISSYVFALSIISGYPVGAKMISDLYEKNLISSKTATKLTTFCSTSGPIFILGTVGVVIFQNKTIGYIIFISHILSSILNGIIFRNFFVEKENLKSNNNLKQNQLNGNNMDYSAMMSNTMTNSILSILVVGGFITIFYVIIDVLFDINILKFCANAINFVLSPISKDLGNSISSGIIEMTRGCIELSKTNASNILKCIVGSGIITFGGFSIHFQALTFLAKAKVNIKFYFIQKLVHTFIACILAYIFAIIFL